MMAEQSHTLFLTDVEVHSSGADINAPAKQCVLFSQGRKILAGRESRAGFAAHGGRNYRDNIGRREIPRWHYPDHGGNDDIPVLADHSNDDGERQCRVDVFKLCRLSNGIYFDQLRTSGFPERRRMA